MYSSQEEWSFYLVVSALRVALVTQLIQEAIRLFRQLMGSGACSEIRERVCESGFLGLKGFVERTGAAIHQTDANIDADTLLHPLILGIM